LATVTYGHHALISGDRKGAIVGTFLTIVLAIIFTSLQGFEYVQSVFSIADGIFGSAFFCSTGLHGLHVLVGTLFITVGFVRMINYHLTATHHQGHEAGIYYWHFVDVVWLFLFVVIYG
jgi:cytochrome c oxidase subunit 3